MTSERDGSWPMVSGDDGFWAVKEDGAWTSSPKRKFYIPSPCDDRMLLDGEDALLLSRQARAAVSFPPALESHRERSDRIADMVARNLTRNVNKELEEE